MLKLEISMGVFGINEQDKNRMDGLELESMHWMFAWMLVLLCQKDNSEI